MFKFAIVLFFVFLFAPTQLHAADTDIIINEIAAHEQSDYEWIEIYNKGSEVVDIAGWKFFESNTNHGITAYRGDMVIEPGEYAVIANKADKVAQKYSTFTGTLIDSSWSSLSESGELIALKNKSGNTIEQFTYISAPDRALERKDPTSSDYTSANWSEHASANTIGGQNSNYSAQQQQQNQNPDTSQQQSRYVWRPSRGVVLFNELVSDPTDMEREWIELYNATQTSIILEGWTIEDGDGGIVRIAGTLGVKDEERYVVIPLSDGFLNNSGDRIVLRSADSIVIDTLTYGSWDDGDITDNAPRAVDPFSLARIGAGVNSFNNRDDFRVTATPTKNAANAISEKESSNDTSPEAQGVIRITEILPNPVSNESTEEFIELYNSGEIAVAIDGWEIVLLSGMKYIFPRGEILMPKEYRAYSRKTTNLALKNSGGERVRLYAQNANRASDEVRYAENVVRGQGYARDSAGRFQWTKQPTPGAQNTFTNDNRPPDVVIEGPLSGRVNDPLTFDASDTRDPDGDPLSFEWHFGDGTVSAGSIVNHAYADEDAFSILLKVSDGKTTVARPHHIIIEEERATIAASIPIAPLPSRKNYRSIKNTNNITSKSTQAKTKKSESLNIVSLSKTRSLKYGSRVQVEGVVSAQPGLVSASAFYIAGSSGIQVWNPKKQFPQLTRGDKVVVSGILKKNNKELAVKITDEKDIVIKESASEPEPRDVKTADISEQTEGWLVRVSGTVANMRWPNVYLDDGEDGVRVYVSKNADIEKEQFRAGDTLTVTGIVSETAAGYRILPRDNNDIVAVRASDSQTGQTQGENAGREPQAITIPAHEDPRASTMRYFYVTLIAALVLAAGLFAQYYLDRKKQK